MSELARELPQASRPTHPRRDANRETWTRARDHTDRAPQISGRWAVAAGLIAARLRWSPTIPAPSGQFERLRRGLSSCLGPRYALRVQTTSRPTG